MHPLTCISGPLCHPAWQLHYLDHLNVPLELYNIMMYGTISILARALVQMPALGPPAPVRGSQKFEAVTHDSAPVGLPIEKDRVRLQVGGPIMRDALSLPACLPVVLCCGMPACCVGHQAGVRVCVPAGL